MPVGEDIVGNFIAGGYVQWTLFDTLSTWGLVADAEAARAKSEADRARQGLLVSADVRTAHAEVQRVLYQRGPLQQAAEVARQNLDILRKRYRIGESLLIELLDGQLQLARAESDLVDNVIAAAVAEAELLSALGRL
jgi:outer membrane protein TolC